MKRILAFVLTIACCVAVFAAQTVTVFASEALSSIKATTTPTLVPTGNTDPQTGKDIVALIHYSNNGVIKSEVFEDEMAIYGYNESIQPGNDYPADIKANLARAYTDVLETKETLAELQPMLEEVAKQIGEVEGKSYYNSTIFYASDLFEVVLTKKQLEILRADPLNHIEITFQTQIPSTERVPVVLHKVEATGKWEVVDLEDVLHKGSGKISVRFYDLCPVLFLRVQPARALPHVGNNGNWFIGNTDTGIKESAGEPRISDGKWFIGNTDTGIEVVGYNGGDDEVGCCDHCPSWCPICPWLCGEEVCWCWLVLEVIVLAIILILLLIFGNKKKTKEEKAPAIVAPAPVAASTENNMVIPNIIININIDRTTGAVTATPAPAPAPQEAPAPAPVEVKEEPAPAPAPAEEVVATVIDDDADVIRTFDAATNSYTVIRNNRSFTARMKQVSDETKAYYSDLRNELEAYGLTGRISWKHDLYHYGRDQLVRLVVRGKTLCVYYALDPKQFADTKYKVEDASDAAGTAEVPCLYRIKNDRRAAYAKDLIAKVMESKGLKKSEEAKAPVNYAKDFRYESTAKLIEKGLVKQKITHEPVERKGFLK